MANQRMVQTATLLHAKAERLQGVGTFVAEIRGQSALLDINNIDVYKRQLLALFIVQLNAVERSPALPLCP